jgi:hypothetical protein
VLNLKGLYFLAPIFGRNKFEKKIINDVLNRDYPIDTIVKVEVERGRTVDRDGNYYDYPVYEFVALPCKTRYLEMIRNDEKLECVQITGDMIGRKLSLERVGLIRNKDYGKSEEDENNWVLTDKQNNSYRLIKDFARIKKTIEQEVVNNQEVVKVSNGTKCVYGRDLNEYARLGNLKTQQNCHAEKIRTL